MKARNGIVNRHTERIGGPPALSFCWWSCRLLCRPEWVAVTTRRSPFVTTTSNPSSACCIPTGVDGSLFPNGLKITVCVAIVLQQFSLYPMAAASRSKAQKIFSLNTKAIFCHFSLNEDSSIRLNTFSLLVEFPLSLKASRPTQPSPISISFTVRRQNSNSSKKTPSQVIAMEWGIPYGLETARAIRKRGSMGAQGADYFSIYV